MKVLELFSGTGTISKFFKFTDDDIKNLKRKFESDNSEKWMFPDRTFCSIPEFFNQNPIIRRCWLTIYARFHGYKITFINGPGPEHKKWIELS